MQDISSLPRRCETWIGARRPLACGSREADGIVWVEPVSGHVRLMTVVPRSAPAEELGERLMEAMLDPWAGMVPGRPIRVLVEDAWWVRGLKILLAMHGIRRLPLTDDAPLRPHFAKLERRCNRVVDERYLSDRETAPEVVGRLFEEAARSRAGLADEASAPTWRIDGIGREPVYGMADASGALMCVGQDAARAVMASRSVQVLFHQRCLDLRYKRLEELSMAMREEILTHGWLTAEGKAPVLQRTDRDCLATGDDIRLVADALETLRLVPARDASAFDGPVWLSDGRRVRVRYPIVDPDALRHSA